MFNSIYLYIILGLVASTASLGWLSVHNYRAKVEAESALVVAINVNTDMQKSLNLKDLSCKIDDKSVVELDAEKKPALRAKGLMTRDMRMVERKKPGRKKARKKFQFSKR